MFGRNMLHTPEDWIDRTEMLIKDWKKYNPENISENVLRDDWRIVFAWASLLRRGKHLKSPQFVEYTIEQQKDIVRRIR